MELIVAIASSLIVNNLTFSGVKNAGASDFGAGLVAGVVLFVLWFAWHLTSSLSLIVGLNTLLLLVHYRWLLDGLRTSAYVKLYSLTH